MAVERALQGLNFFLVLCAAAFHAGKLKQNSCLSHTSNFSFI